MLHNFLSGTYGTNNTAGKILKEVCPTCTFPRKIQKGCLSKGRKHSADLRDSYRNRSVNDKTNIQQVFKQQILRSQQAYHMSSTRLALQMSCSVILV